MKEAQIAAAIHRIGEEIIALADYLAVYVMEENAEGAVPPAAEEQPAAPAIKLEEVRTVLAEISRSGKTAQMKELLGRFGAGKDYKMLQRLLCLPYTVHRNRKQGRRRML